MPAPRALDMPPGQKRIFKILVHKDQVAEANPTFGPPLKLPVLKEIPFTTETEIRRRMGGLDDHLLAQYPEIMEDLVPWLARKAEGGGETDEDELREHLSEILQLRPEQRAVSEAIIRGLLTERILFGDRDRIVFEDGERTLAETGDLLIAGPGVGKPPPFTTAMKGAEWALINTGGSPQHAARLLEHLDTMELDDNGEISESNLEEFLEKRLFERWEYNPEPRDLIKRLIEANVILKGSNELFYDASISGKSNPYVVNKLKQRLVEAKRQGKPRSYLLSLQKEIGDREGKIGHAGHFEEPAQRSRPTRYVPVTGRGKQPARAVQDLLPGDLIFATGRYANKVMSIELGKGGFYTLTLSTPQGPTTKRFKSGKLIGIEREAGPVEPTYHPVSKLHIDDPKLVDVLAHFEGKEWAHKQHMFPTCHRCVFGNKQAWQILQNIGPKAKGLTIDMILDGGGRIKGADHTKHWYQIDPDGHIGIEKKTADEFTRAAMQEVGIEPV